MTGAPIYLVSACGSGEEFVAAFRRYADRNHVVFVPIAAPLPPGKKARFALTLKDGGVMIEGDGEVVSSSPTPSVLYGRIGMTLKFTLPDDPSKIVLGELEKARLALKPTPPSVPPRPAALPEHPRATPPAPGGRIDAVNALAECVAIGDAIPPRNAGAKFVAPSIATSVARPLPTQPPVDLGVTMRGTKPAAALMAPAPAPPPVDLGVTIRGTKPAAALTAPAARMNTPAAPMPIVQQPATPRVADPMRTIPEIEVGEPTDLVAIPHAHGAAEDAIPQAVSESFEQAPVPVPAPAEPKGRETRKTVLGMPIVPSGMVVLPAAPAPRLGDEENRDTAQMAAEEPVEQAVDVYPSDPVAPAVQPSLAPLGAPTVEEPTPSGDWTMTPGADGPTITRTPRSEKPAPPGPPTGDWLIALDPSQPDGWSEPSKVEQRPAGELPASPPQGPGPPMSAVSSSRLLDSNRRAQTDPIDIGGPSVLIDPSLVDSGPVGLPPLGPPTEPQPIQPIPAPTPAAFGPPPLSQSYLASSSPMNAPTDSMFDASYGSGPVPATAAPGRRRRTMFIAIVALAAVGLLLAVVLGRGGGGSKKPDTRAVVAPATDAGTKSLASASPDAAAVVAPAINDAAVAVAPATCSVSIATVPAGAEIVIDKAVVGTGPTALALPCGVETKVTARKARFVTQSRSITPKAEGQKRVMIVLSKVTMSVKVSSVPPGASITVGTKAMGFTPTTVKLPAFEVSSMKVSKDGYMPDIQKITPKQNNQSVKIMLKKIAKRGAR